MRKICVRILPLAICLFILSANVFSGTLSREETADLFSQGKDLFRRANQLAARNPEEAKKLYRDAAMRFERIAREGGVHNGRLYYNIGNGLHEFSISA